MKKYPKEELVYICAVKFLKDLVIYVESINPELTETEVMQLVGILLLKTQQSIDSNPQALAEMKEIASNIISQRNHGTTV